MKLLANLCLLLCLNCFAQDFPLPPEPKMENVPPDTLEIYDIVEEMPKFPGGDSLLLVWIRDNLNYPEEAKEEGVEARVYVRFIVEHDGSLSNIHMVHIRTEDRFEVLFKKEALRLVTSMPAWTPGKMMGRIVRTSYTIPVYFRVR